MSTDDGGQKPGGQSLDVDDLDEAKVPTAPMKAVPANLRPHLHRPMPDFDDDEEDDEPRHGSRENPFTETRHPRISLDPEVATQVLSAQTRKGPNMAMVLVRVLVLLGVLAGVGYGVLRALR